MHGANGVGKLTPQTYQGAQDQHSHGKCQTSMPSQNQGGLGKQEVVLRYSSCRTAFIQAVRTKVVLDTACARFPYLCPYRASPPSSQAVVKPIQLPHEYIGFSSPHSHLYCGGPVAIQHCVTDCGPGFLDENASYPKSTENIPVFRYFARG